MPYMPQSNYYKQATKIAKNKKVKDRFYDSPVWQAMRQTVLIDNPFCSNCHKAIATEIHHIQARQLAPDLALDSSNLQALCKPCHSSETMREIQERKTKAKAG